MGLSRLVLCQFPKVGMSLDDAKWNSLSDTELNQLNLKPVVGLGRGVGGCM